MPVTVLAGRKSGSMTVGVFGGLCMIRNPEAYREKYRNSIGFGGECLYSFSETASVGLSAVRIPFRRDLEKIRDAMGVKTAGAQWEISGGDSDVRAFSANLIKIFSPPEASSGLTVSLGGAYYWFKFNDILYRSSCFRHAHKGRKSVAQFGLNGGLGLEFRICRRFPVLVESKYHYIFTRREESGFGFEADNSISGKVQFITLMAGTRIGLGH
jgi:hypothetical protein